MAPPPPPICGYGEIGRLIEKKYEEFGFKRLDGVFACIEEKVDAGYENMLDLFVKESAIDDVIKHCYEMALDGKEAMGFLIGDVMVWENRFSIVNEAVTSSLISSPTYVKFGAFEEIFDRLDEIEYEYIIIGWYHSHLGCSSFMSVIDVETQRKYFNKDFHVAIVFDPIKLEMKAFRLRNNKCVEIPFAIFK